MQIFFGVLMVVFGLCFFLRWDFYVEAPAYKFRFKNEGREPVFLFWAWASFIGFIAVRYHWF